MKRIWIGIGLLAAILVLGICTAEGMERQHQAAAGELRQAAELAAEENWEAAEVRAGQAMTAWHKKWPLTAAAADHEPMDEIDALFAELQIYAAVREKISFCSTCARLSSLLEAMAQSHSLTWRNLL